MSLFGKHAAVLVLAALAGFSALEVSAAQPTNNKAKVETVSMLGGKFKFSLPKGFIANPLPAGDEASGTAGATGTMYTNASTKTVVIAAQNLIPDAVQAKDNDAQFLDSAVSGFLLAAGGGPAGLQQAERKKHDPRRPRPAPDRQHRDPGRRHDPELHPAGRLG